MAHSKSAKKRILVAERNRDRNQAVKSRVKTMLKKVLVAVETKEVEAAN
ncbi:MAG: 30S ribosomal protein S20, partial [Cetobacterium sp.]